MNKIKVGINGFGRIGRAIARIASQTNAFDLIAVNTRKTPPDLLAYLLKYDSVYRRFDKPVNHDADHLYIDGNAIHATQIAEPEQIPWNEYGVDVVIDATGAFTKTEDLKRHIKGSVKKVILTAPAKDDMQHVVMGVNDETTDFANTAIISNASCTTNCAAPMFKVLHDHLKVTSGFLTTVHAYTATQSLVDEANKSPDRSRSAAINTAPSTTGAAVAVVKVIPDLKGKLDGMAVRVPVPTGSFTDITANVEKPTSIEELNALFKHASEHELKGIMGYESDMLVSSDYIGSPFSVIFDENYTNVINGTMVKVTGWYDNEWGYSCRVVDLVKKVAQYL